MPQFADLHIHTHFSDSTSSPEEVIRQAVEQGISCVAVTDHDTVDGIAPAAAAGDRCGVEVIAGIELSTEFENKDIHLLGYFIDPEDGPFRAQLKSLQSGRVGRMRLMIGKLEESGIGNITLDEVCAMTESDAVGRPHLAAVLVEKGLVPTTQQAFDKYLAEGKPAYVPKMKMSPVEGIQLIRECGGVPVLAHPMLNNRDELIPGMVDAGLEGLEVYYPRSSPAVTSHYEDLARKHGLVMTGGSDAHGEAKTHTWVGKVKIPYELVEGLARRRDEIQSQP